MYVRIAAGSGSARNFASHSCCTRDVSTEKPRNVGASALHTCGAAMARQRTLATACFIYRIIALLRDLSYPGDSYTYMAESPITARSQDFAAWYQDVVLQGDM